MNFNVITPHNEPELLAAVSEYQDNFRFGAGFTDLILEIKKQAPKGLTVINLAQLKDDHFTLLVRDENGINIGSMVTVAMIENDEFIRKNLPVLHQAASSLASAQIRQVATVGGNICTASPSGDVACALVALNAICEILNTSGQTREIPIREFFTGPRKTAMQKNDILRRIIVPLNKDQKDIHSGFIKVGTRRSMECSVVSLSYHIRYDSEGLITHAGIAIGAAAPTIRFATNACDFLEGKNIRALSNTIKETFSNKILEYASPISDIRASAWYRKEALGNISRGMLGVEW